jgi:ABC-type Fe3+ transport system substrate-binding protein
MIRTDQDMTGVIACHFLLSTNLKQGAMKTQSDVAIAVMAMVTRNGEDKYIMGTKEMINRMYFRMCQAKGKSAKPIGVCYPSKGFQITTGIGVAI